MVGTDPYLVSGAFHNPLGVLPSDYTRVDPSYRQDTPINMFYARRRSLTTEGNTILVIEDEEELRQLLTRTLERSEFNVVEAQNGEMGLQAARRLSGSLCLVVTDINMPVMSGLEFAREFRPLQPRVPILFISGLDARITLPETVRLGGTLLLKPFGPEVFLETVTRVLTPVDERSLA